MTKPSQGRALPMAKPTGPETYEVSVGAGFWPELRHVHRSHREDLEAMLRDHGRSPDEFYVSDTPSWIDPPRFEQNGVIHGPSVNEVIVRSRRTGKAYAYDARSPGRMSGPYTKWVKDFEKDLLNGLFE